VHFLQDQNLYICYYAVSSLGTQNGVIGIATSPSMADKTWTGHGSTGLESKDGDPYNAIDANLLVDGGTNRITFGSFWQNIHQTTFSADGLKWSGQRPVQLAYNDTGAHSLEGPFVYKTGGHYYLFFSSGQCCGYDKSRPKPGEEYKIMVCRSERVDGGYVSLWRPVLRSVWSIECTLDL
jgi:arabinan endo-1,5-alpha-L-arabinosidase